MIAFSIGWGHGKTFTMNLEDFESARPPRRAQMDLVLSRGERHRLLVEWGASGQDVIEAIRMIIRVKNQRRQTVNNLGSYDRIEWVFEKFTRGVRNVFSNRNNARELKIQSEKAAAANVSKTTKPQSQATALTVGETVHHSIDGKASQKLTGTEEAASCDSSGERDSPPFREVKLVNQDQSDSSAENMEYSAKPLLTESNLEEYRSRENSAVNVNINDLHQVSKQEESVGNRADSVTETYDDVDDMSNPQSHDHRRGRRIARRPDSVVDC